MTTTVAELAALVGGRVVGEPEVAVTGFAPVEAAGPGDITFATGEKYRALAQTSPAAAVVVGETLPDARAVQILVADPNLAFARIVDRMVRKRRRGRPGIHPRALIEAGAEIHPEAAIQAQAVVCRGARVGARSVLFPGVYVGEEAVIGEECILHPNVVVMERVRIGDRVIIHGGAVIGADGFGYAQDPDGVHVKIPQTGTVVIEDDVEIGACSCIDRARFDETRIGKGTKIDNLVQIGHNVTIGAHSLVVSQVGIAGSTKLGHHVVLAGHVGVAGHLEIGDGVQVSAYSGVATSLEAGQAYMGIPARPIHQGRRIRALEGRLPQIWERLREMEKRLKELQGNGQAGTGDGSATSLSKNPGVGPPPSEDKPGKEPRRGVSERVERRDSVLLEGRGKRYGEEARRSQAQPQPAEASRDSCSGSESGAEAEA